MNEKTTGKDHESGLSDSDSKAETISIDSASTDASKSTKKKKETHSNKSKKDDVADVYMCSTCKYTNVAWFEFKTHCKVMHRVTVLFPCTIPDCYKYYISKNDLKGHCTSLHKDVLTCTQCNHMATSLETLQEHTMSHRDKKFLCLACKCGFGSKWDLNRHFVKCLDNPDQKITCKQCSASGKSNDVSGAEDGLVTHLQEEHNLRGEWLCENCHCLLQSEKHLETQRGKKIAKAQPSSTEDEQNDD